MEHEEKNPIAPQLLAKAGILQERAAHVRARRNSLLQAARQMSGDAAALQYEALLLTRRSKRTPRRKAFRAAERPPFAAEVMRAAEIMGSQRALAAACSVKPGTIWAAINTKSRCPPWLAVRIIDATLGKVSMKELLPDVYDRVESEISERAGPREVSAE